MPLTGVERFDQLVFGTNDYQVWTSNLERRGYTIEEKTLTQGNPANITRDRVVEIDPDQFRYSDLYHEKRHIFQNMVAERQTGSGVLEQSSSNNRYFRRLAELDAYNYEMTLAKKYGFSQDYSGYLQAKIRENLIGVKPKVENSPSVGAFAEKLRFYQLGASGGL